MKRSGRWAAVIGVVCGAELVVVAVIGGAGLASLFSIEAAVGVACLGGVVLWTLIRHRARRSVEARS